MSGTEGVCAHMLILNLHDTKLDFAHKNFIIKPKINNINQEKL